MLYKFIIVDGASLAPLRSSLAAMASAV